MRPLLKKLNALLATDYYGITQTDICNHFNSKILTDTKWHRQYISRLQRGRDYASDEQIQRIIDELPNIAKNKRQEVAA